MPRTEMLVFPGNSQQSASVSPAECQGNYSWDFSLFVRLCLSNMTGSTSLLQQFHPINPHEDVAVQLRR